MQTLEKQRKSIEKKKTVLKIINYIENNENKQEELSNISNSDLKKYFFFFTLMHQIDNIFLKK